MAEPLFELKLDRLSLVAFEFPRLLAYRSARRIGVDMPVDRHFGVDGVTQHPLFSEREDSEPRIAEIGHLTCNNLLVQRQNGRRQPCLAVIGKSDGRQWMMLIDRGLIEVDALRGQLAC